MTKTTDFWVGDRFVRPSLGEIQLGLERVHLEPRSMEVLLALARRPREVIPKQELIEAVWGEAFVSDEVLTHAIWDLRRAFGDNASDPEFIQTVPKRGYRLIAPVKPVEPHRRRASDQREAAGWSSRLPAGRWIVWGLVLVFVVAASYLWVSPAEEPALPLPTAPPRPSLVLVATDSVESLDSQARSLDVHISNGLAGLPGVDVRSAASCDTISGARDGYCLEPTLTTITDGYQASAALLKAPSRERVYGSPVRSPRTREELSAFADEVSELVRASLAVLRHRRYRDRDITPWISLQRHDPRAISYFLVGVDFVYLDEVGGRVPMARAIDLDGDFIAPHVWMTPSMVGDAAAGDLDPETLEAHRRRLKRLYAQADAFEAPMVEWAIALMDRNWPVAIRQLKIALKARPGNRPARVALGSLLMQEGNYEEAWEMFSPLLEQRWGYPGLYGQAAQCALCLGNIEETRSTLALVGDSPTIDPAVLELLRLFAIHDGNAGDEQKYRQELAERKREMFPEEVDLRISCLERLIGSAEAKAEEIAARLRESAD